LPASSERESRDAISLRAVNTADILNKPDVSVFSVEKKGLLFYPKDGES
jgi:hypothetical protein